MSGKSLGGACEAFPTLLFFLCSTLLLCQVLGRERPINEGTHFLSIFSHLVVDLISHPVFLGERPSHGDIQEIHCAQETG